MITKAWLEKMQSRLSLTAVSALALTLVPALADASVAGHVQFVAGDVRIVDAAGKARVAQKGQEINEGETVLTAAGSSAQLKMIDGGILALRPETELKVDAYVFQGAQDGSENALLSLLKGGLRTITGLIGQQNKEKLKLRTPTAVIGIRGTDHEPIVLVEPTPGTPTANPLTNPPGTYDKVNVGATSLTTDAGTAVIGPNQVGYAASLTQAPVLLPKLPNFYRATPTPLAKIDQKHQGQSSTSQSTTENAAPVASAAAASSTDTKTEAVSVAPVVPVTELTGVDADGNVLNLAQQTLTTASGQVQALGANTTISSGGSSGSNSGSGSGSSSSGSSGAPVTAAAGSLLLIALPIAQSEVGAIPQFFSFGGAGLSLSNDTTGNLTAASLSGSFNAADSSGDFSFGTGAHFSMSQSGSTLVNFGSNAATGLAWGRWQGGTVTESGQNYGQDASGNWGLGANSSGTFVIGATETDSVVLGSGSLHWITAANPTPYYLPLVLTGTANYTLIGGTSPTDQNGNVGTLNSASLGVNFTTQVANAGLNFTVAGNNWVMQSGPMLLNGAQFSTYSNCTDTQCANNVSLTKNGVLTSSTPNGTSPNVNYSIGNLSGFLTGAGLNGAALEYSVQDVTSTVAGSSTQISSSIVQGVAAFSGPTQDVTTPFRVVGIDDGWNNLSNLVSSSASTTYNYAPSYHGNIVG
ncbi:MAG TPA: FecR family protein, partial [Burkholderiaceae bacterium]|nr:FecR family protein [Burkholderiaceae bacterium]